MGWNWDHMGAWGMAWGWLFMVLLIVGLVVLVMVLLRLPGGAARRHDPYSVPRSRARDLLDERYARGEIDDTEYDTRRRRLDEGAGT